MQVVSDLIGQVIGSYEIVELLGKGSMGEVYRAHDRALNREVAVKLVRITRENRSALKRLVTEAQTMARLEHPNIVPVYDVGISMPFLYVVMRLLRGKTLLQRINSGLLTIDETVVILKQIAAGLQHAHGQGVIHRDLKPENVLLTAEGAHLMDFGLALNIGGEDDLSKMVVGTPHYIAPELWEKHEADPRTDLYALGVIAYTMLCKRRPFDGTVREMRYLHLNVYPPPPKHLNKSVGEELSDIVMKLLHKDPEKRYQNAGQLIEDLDRYLQGVAVHASAEREDKIVCSFCGAANEKTRKRCEICNELLQPLKIQIGTRPGETECPSCGRPRRRGERCPRCGRPPETPTRSSSKPRPRR